jgi:hypothetical protein
VYYIDTSALVKLVVREPETDALRRLLARVDPRQVVTGAIARAELLRAARRRDEATVSKAREVLDAVARLTLTEARLDRAGTLDPPVLRTLDAIHLAGALELGPSLTALVAYDERLLAAAAANAIPVVSPR